MQNKKVLAKVILAISVFFTVFQLYTATHGLMTAVLQRSIHISFVLALVFMIFPFKENSKLSYIIDIPLCLVSLGSAFYLYHTFDDLVFRLGNPNQWDIFLGIATVIVLLEATRRVVGWPMTILGIFSIFYILYGNILPEPFGHKALSLDRMISQLYLTTEGIFGIPLGVAATYVFLFVFFGSLMEKSGVGDLFINLAQAFAGKYQGGPAKVGIVSSAAVGMVSGSPVSDAATTGAFTIPLMVKLGYRPTLAAAIEAVAASGASLMPPIMGAGAFVMADISGIPYVSIIGHALIPALLFYAGLMFVVGNEARKANMKSLSKEDLPGKKDSIVKSLRLFIPLFILVFSLAVLRVSPLRAALYSTYILIFVTLVYNYFKPEFRVPLKVLAEASFETPRKVLTVSVACATAGIIIGMLGLTGLGLKLSNILISVSHGHLLVALIIAMFIAIVLGMGLPPTGAYIVMAVTVAPSLFQMGLPQIVAHFFIFMFACYAPITPPVALAAYTTSGIAGCNPFRAGLEAFRISLSGFVLPFIMAYGTSLLGLGHWYNILLASSTALMGIWALSISIVGFYQKRTSILWRIILMSTALMLIAPGVITDIIGFFILANFVLTNTNLFKKRKPEGSFIVSDR